MNHNIGSSDECIWMNPCSYSRYWYLRLIPIRYKKIEKIYGNPNTKPTYVWSITIHTREIGYWCVWLTFVFFLSKCVQEGSDLGFTQASRVLINDWIIFLWVSSCALEFCHFGTEKGPAQSVATKWEMHNSQEHHWMLQHQD